MVKKWVQAMSSLGIFTMLPQAPSTKHTSVCILYEVHRPADTEDLGAGTGLVT